MRKFIYISLAVLIVINLFFLIKEFHVSYIANLVVAILVYILYRLLSYTGERQNSFQIKFEKGDEVLAVSLGKDGQGKVFPYYMCKNGERCYLKLPEE